MESKHMAIETGAAGYAGIKAGLIGGALVFVVSFLAVVLGFKVVPLKKGAEHEDATRRLSAGLLSSFTLGPLVAIKVIGWQPELLTYWINMVGPENTLWANFLAGVPFIALTGLVGFWVVAAIVAWFAKREGKDIGELVRDARNEIHP
jgi:hypothetical protein